jgi:hypothetical protein
MKLEVGEWKLEIRNWKMETGKWKLESETELRVISIFLVSSFQFPVSNF